MNISKFKKYIDEYPVITLDNIKSAAVKALPAEYREKPWCITKQGGSDVDNTIYTNELQLNAYLASYTDWHKGKLERAFALLKEPLSRQINIIDWACGQGMATLFILDYIRQNVLPCSVKEVILVEPSKVALDRAIYLITKAAPDLVVRPVNKKIDDVTANDLAFNHQAPVYQMFSNILDIGGIDLKHLTQILYGNRLESNTLICVSPYYSSGNRRIESFFRYFQRPLISELVSDKRQRGYTYNIGIVKLSPSTEQQIIGYEFCPAVQFRAAYELSAIHSKPKSVDYLSYFNVLAPFDLGASITDDVHPVLAVLNNIITRGLSTFPSPFVERAFCTDDNIVHETSGNGIISFELNCDTEGANDLQDVLDRRADFYFSENLRHNEIAYTPIAIARIQKLLIEILISGRLSLKTPEWNILVEEDDVPCAALAIEDFRQMFDTLTSVSQDYDSLKLPKINLYIVGSREYAESQLHRGVYHVADVAADLTNKEYDLVIHYSSNPQTSEYTFGKFRAKNDCCFAIFSADKEHLTAERYVYTSDRVSYKPFVTMTSQGLYQDIDENVLRLTYFLNLLFRKEKFRNGQLPILTRAMSNMSVIGLLPTGSGKSLTYQIAAMLQPGITIVIDPLISLMKDQYDGLRKASVDSCTFINSTVVNKGEREELMERSKVQFVFMSPERLCIRGFRNRLRNMHDLHVYFAYGVIDEVHCVSEWGHDFRFSYLHLGRNLYNYVLPKQSGNQTERIALFGLTATASFDVLADVERELSGNGAFPLDSDAIVRYENTNRLELQYKVIKVDGNGCYNKWDVYRSKNDMLPSIVEKSCDEIRQLQSEESISRIKKRFAERESITNETILSEIEKADLSVEVSDNWYSEMPNKAAAIVFCPHRRGSIGVNSTGTNTGVVDSLRSNLADVRVSTYVGGDVLTEQDHFIAGDTSIMVATKAFGMGIDKPNVRFTYNMNFSGSLEAFIQEAGRAGRDRKMALATILYCPKQFMEQNPRTGLMGSVPVDYGVHKFFFNNNFIGKDFEKEIMYYLMTQSIIGMSDGQRTSSSEIQYKQVAGFMQELLNTKVGDELVSYISYDFQINGPSVQRLNIRLTGKNYPILVFKDPRDIKDGEVDFVAAIEKVIYRMCSVGIIDDYTRDYQNSQFRIVTKRKTDEDYFNHLKLFLMRYYTEERADIEMHKAFNYRGDNAMQKCLGYLTDFVYDKIAGKRERAIRDIETFCEQAVNSTGNWLEVNEDLKDFIYYYFNSKFAREDYVAQNGVPYSLTADTEHGKISSFDILFKYMNVVDDAVVGSSGSPKDNIKHLQGAIRLIRRSLTDSNPALDLLNVYCMLYLNATDTETLRREMRDSFINGYREFKARTEDYDDFCQKMTSFIRLMQENKILSDVGLSEINEWQQIGEIYSQLEWLKKFKKQYIG